MTDTPDDLIPLTQVIAEYKPARKWWSARIEAGEITVYKQPGTRGFYLSRADVEALLRPHRLAIRTEPREPTQ
jgi:hypothetical protein